MKRKLMIQYQMVGSWRGYYWWFEGEEENRHYAFGPEDARRQAGEYDEEEELEPVYA